MRHHLTTPLEDSQQEAQLRAMLLCEIGWTWYDVGDNIKALSKYSESEQVLHAAGIERGPAWAKILLQRSYVYWRQGNYAEAQRIAQQSLELFTESAKHDSPKTTSFVTLLRRTLAGDPSNIGRVHVILGDIESATGHYTDALSHFNTASPIFEQFERQREIAIVCCNVGDVYLRRSEYDEAQEMLRRSQSIAERIGDMPLASVVSANMGIGILRLGNIAEATIELARATTGSERINDIASVSPCSSFLAGTFQEQGKLTEAETALLRALTTAHKTSIPPYIALALISIGNFRIMQALDVNATPEIKRQLLLRGQRTLQRALRIEGMEADTRVEAQLLLAHVLFLLGNDVAAKKLANSVLEEADSHDMVWLLARAHRLLGDILTQQARFSPARKNYQQARSLFNDCDMKLEHARTVHHYGLLFLRLPATNEANKDEQHRQRGLSYLRSARETFIRCGATLDVQLVERDMEIYKGEIGQWGKGAMMKFE